MSSDLLSPSRTPATKRNKQVHGFQVTPEQGQSQNSPKRKVAPKNAIATPKRPPRTNTLQVETETLKESEKPPEDKAADMDTQDNGSDNPSDTQSRDDIGNEEEEIVNHDDGDDEDHENEDHIEAANNTHSEKQDTDKKAGRRARKEAKREKKAKKKKKKKKSDRKSKSKSKQKKKTEPEVESEQEKTSSEEEEEQSVDANGADEQENDPGATGTGDNMEVEADDQVDPTYAETAQNGDDDATVVAENDKWVARRVKISIEIKVP